jgi:D-alanyl-D-alanine carboxypeptidase (penicillin-binding protein 5/6)
MLIFRFLSRRRAILLLMIILFQLTPSFKIFAQNEPNIQSDSAIVMDSKTGTVIYSKNIHKKQYPASITKIMTALLAIEKGNLDDTITFSNNAVYSIGWGSSHIGMREGEQITLNDAMYGMLLMSANEVSNAIAEHIDGSIENFCKNMNDKAKDLGAYNTNFVNPHGLHDPNHYTTAYDMALITKEALKYDKFREISGTITYIIEPTNLVNEPRYLAHQHRLYNKKAYPNSYYEGCEGGKTGFTNEAKHTLVSYAKKDDLELIVVVLKAEKQEMYNDTRLLLDYCFDNFELVTLIEEGDSAGEISIPLTKDGNDEKTIEVYAKENLETVMAKELTEEITNDLSISKDLSLPINEGDIVGTLNYFYQNKLLASVDVISSEKIEGNDAIETMSTKGINKTGSSTSYLDNRIVRIAIMLIVTLVIMALFFYVLYLINRYKQRKRPSYFYKNYGKR